jgi:ribonuclease P protein component
VVALSLEIDERRGGDVSASERIDLSSAAAAAENRPAEERQKHSERFQRRSRIVEQGTFVDLLSSGKRSASGGFILVYRRRTTGTARLGLLVTRRHSKSAVRRNALKRMIREVFRANAGELGALDILVRPPMTGSRRKEQARTLERALRKLK